MVLYINMSSFLELKFIETVIDAAKKLEVAI